MPDRFGVGVTFLAQRSRIGNGFVLAGRGVQPCDLRERRAVFGLVANLAPDVFPIRFRHRRIAFRDPHRRIERELARDTIRRHVDFRGGVPIARGVTARAVRIRSFANVVRIRMRAFLPRLTNARHIGS